MNTHKIAGGGAIQLHAVEAGNAAGRPILFIHGLSQCWLNWSRQLDSDLARDCRLVAMDMRGHGLSDKPADAYADSKLWADDVHAVIQGLKLDRPLLCGWSYGPLVMLDYVRHYGEEAISGLHFVGGVTRLGSPQALAVLTPEFLGLVPGFFASDVEESVRSLDSLLRLCFPRGLSAEERYLMLGFGISVPPRVRQALLSRSVDNEDLLPKLRKPVLITQGRNDAVVKPEIVDQHKAAIAHAQIDMPDTGHAAFWEDAAAFNRRILEFVRQARD
ncbi:MAG TPA: alpha/beta hydrolase [Bryobacteraceae bacterium]